MYIGMWRLPTAAVKGYDQLLRITNRDFKIICYLLKSQDCYIIVKLLDLISDMFSCMVWNYLSLFYNNHNESKYIKNIISNCTIYQKKSPLLNL